jgi:hypothetical protein
MRVRLRSRKRIGLSARSASSRYSIRRPFHSPGPVLPVTDLKKKPVGGLASGIQLLRFRYIHGFWNTGVVLSHPSRKVASSSFFDFAQNDKREPALSGVEGVGTQFYQDA